MVDRAASRRLASLKHIAIAAVALLAAKVLVAILLEYRSYFPPDFVSAFFTVREATFTTLYAMDSYSHLVIGPLSMFLGAWVLRIGA